MRFEERELVASSVDNDEGALSKAKVSWLFGEWNDLVEMDQVILADHPVREKLVLLKASAHQQLGHHDEARKFTRMALDWGCSPRIVAQIMIAGVHNTLGRIAALKQDEERISNHFFKAVDVIVQGGRTELVSHARAVREMTKLGLLPQAAGLVDKELQAAQSALQRPKQQRVKLDALKADLGLLHKELSCIRQQVQTNVEHVSSPKIVGLSSIRKLNDRIRDSSARIIVAGMRHCGSTALFNIIRLSMVSCNINFQSCYSEYGELADRVPDEKGIYLLKTHEFRDDVAGFADTVLTSRRDLRDTVASAVRRDFYLLNKMGQVEYAKYNRMLHDSWSSISDYEFVYEEFMSNPVETIEKVLSFLGIEGVDSSQVYCQLTNLPVDDYENTLLSPTHITDPERKFSYIDSLDGDIIRKIESHNSKWLEMYGYA